ncbi:MAG: hypothetical protein MJ252_16385 [archaeon]|nr:hypothetical protein [archaeon]
MEVDEEEGDNIEQTQETRTEKIIRIIKNAFFHTYYNISKGGFSSNVLYIILISIEFLQMAHFTLFNFNYDDKEGENNSDYKEKHSKIEFFVNLMEILQQLFFGKFKVFPIIVLFLSLAYAISHIVLFFYFKSRKLKISKDHKILSDYSLKIMLYLDVFMITFLTIPVYISLFSFCQCDSDNKYLLTNKNINCHSGMHYAYLSLSVISLTLNFLLGMLTTQFLNNHQPTGLLPWSSTFNDCKTIIYVAGSS